MTRHLLAWIAFVALATTGCSTLGLPQAKVSDEYAATTQPVATFFVEVRQGREEPQVRQLPLSEAMTVQTVLEKTGCLGRFRKMDIVLERPLPAQIEPLRMDVTYDRQARRVSSEVDYAIRPGDRLIVTEDRRTQAEEVLESLLDHLGPLGDR